MPPLPHHRAYGSVPRRFGGLSFHPPHMEGRRLPAFRIRMTPQRLTPACPNRGRRFTPPGRASAEPCRLSVLQALRDTRATRPLLQPLAGTVRAFSRRGDLLRPLLTSAPRSGSLAAPSVRPVSRMDTAQISRGKPRGLPRTPAGFTARPLMDMDFATSCPLVRPTLPRYPISVRQVAISFHASFRRSLAVPPLRFTRAPPPSGCTGDFHPQTAGHARHTGRCAP